MRTVLAEIKNGDLLISGEITEADLVSNLFNIDTSGNLSISNIEEGPIGIPSDAYYFPLDFDTFDITKQYKAVKENGLVFQGGDVIVGHDKELNFNLNASIGLDWSGDWSIIYYRTPQSTASNDLLGYDIDSLGSNSNSVGGGYIYWGKMTGSDSLLGTTPAAIDPNKYFNNRQAISIIKKGSVITFRHRFIGGVEYTRTSSSSTTVANYYVNQYGYDLKLGGWDNQGASNAKYRDLIVVKRAISDEELKQLTQVFCSINSNVLRIQGNIIEGAVL